MKKKLFGLLLLVASVFVLVACSTSNSNQPADGKYYSFYESDKEIGITEVVVDGDALTIFDHVYTIDTEKKQLVEGNKTLDYEYKDSVIIFDGISHVLYGSDKYQELLDEGYIVQ